MALKANGLSNECVVDQGNIYLAYGQVQSTQLFLNKRMNKSDLYKIKNKNWI